MPDADGYRFTNLREALGIWEYNEPASAAIKEVRERVVNWALDRHTDPYQGAKRVDGLPNVWFSRIPGTQHDGQMVCCQFWIMETTRTVRFDMFSTLSLPI
ncbi:hypothetical protein [Spongiactinospora sp. TRM90649]|uniref:hypothetical protein n=1 Tax=Spongiactinospora sp. TRM90649 TaxID=3031114 RepID=UPI0023F6684D|nr:hypothetical protein [Spongiactinospora sp. TRM90649]MDF5759201.1 hypothetical protein [Spongiactinospora sp. TRM90649]